MKVFISDTNDLVADLCLLYSFLPDDVFGDFTCASVTVGGRFDLDGTGPERLVFLPVVSQLGTLGILCRLQVAGPSWLLTEVQDVALAQIFAQDTLEEGDIRVACEIPIAPARNRSQLDAFLREAIDTRLNPTLAEPVLCRREEVAARAIAFVSGADIADFERVVCGYMALTCDASAQIVVRAACDPDDEPRILTHRGVGPQPLDRIAAHIARHKPMGSFVSRTADDGHPRISLLRSLFRRQGKRYILTPKPPTSALEVAEILEIMADDHCIGEPA